MTRFDLSQLALTASFFGLLPQAAFAQSSDAYLRVVDVGNGLCVVAHTPDGHSMLYDAGDRGQFCFKAVQEIVPEGVIDLVVLSHSDGDHVGELDTILSSKSVGTIIHPGDPHQPMTETLRQTRKAIVEAGQRGTRIWNVAQVPLPSGPTALAERRFAIGGANATIIAGWGNGSQTRGPGEPSLDDGERNNALSIVVRFEFGGRSVLLTGDTVGRHIDDVPATCKNAERIMVEQALVWPIQSDVLVGQHHGADNATSNCFIAAVKPGHVVFSAGHKNYRHPRNSTVRRLLQSGLSPDNIFRTDRGDNEPWKKGARWREQEWIYGAVKGCTDKAGDDDVEIWLPSDPARPIRIQYRQDKRTC